MGCNNFAVRCDLEQSRAVVDQAIASGITLFDTADNYGNRGGSEEFLGRILGSRRRDVVIATKFGSPMDDAGLLKGASRRYVMTAVEASLTRLQTDWIDLYQLHRPDPATPIEETLRALDDLVRQGKVRYIGASNFTAAEVIERRSHRARARASPLRFDAERVQPARARTSSTSSFPRSPRAASACCPTIRWRAGS